MSIKGFYKDLLALGLLISIPIVLVASLYSYFTTNDATYLYLGIGIAILMVLGAIAKYRFFVDYVWTLIKKWK